MDIEEKETGRINLVLNTFLDGLITGANLWNISSVNFLSTSVNEQNLVEFWINADIKYKICKDALDDNSEVKFQKKLLKNLALYFDKTVIKSDK